MLIKGVRKHTTVKEKGLECVCMYTYMCGLSL